MGNPSLAISPCGRGPAPEGMSWCQHVQGWSRADVRSSQSKESPCSLCPRAGAPGKEESRESHLPSPQERQGWLLTAPVRSELPSSPLLLLPSSLPPAGSETSLSRDDPERKRALPSPQSWQAHSKTQLEREISL